jgi:hypothetical protein
MVWGWPTHFFESVGGFDGLSWGFETYPSLYDGRIHLLVTGTMQAKTVHEPLGQEPRLFQFLIGARHRSRSYKWLLS